MAKKEKKKQIRTTKNTILNARRLVRGKQEEKVLESCFQTIPTIKATCSICRDISLIAMGTAEFFIHLTSNLCKWDTCAAQIILEEAGGRISHGDGSSLNYRQQEPQFERLVVISNGILHDEVITRIARLKN